MFIEYISFERINFLYCTLLYFLIYRRRKGEKIFLVAFYECDEDYELENLEQDRLFCSQESWVGDMPRCMAINDEGEDEDEENGEEGEGESKRVTKRCMI